jgi:hypothetical protein
MSLWKEHPKDVQTILEFVMDYKLLPYHEFIIEYLNKKVEMTHKVLEEYKVFSISIDASCISKLS